MRKIISFSLVVLCLYLPGTAGAEILPEEVAILANSASQDSMELAKYYSHARKIPQSNIISLPLPKLESITRETFYKDLVIPLKQRISNLVRSQTITTLVIMYDVPLHIQELPQSSIDIQEYIKEGNQIVAAHCKTALKNVSNISGSNFDATKPNFKNIWETLVSLKNSYRNKPESEMKQYITAVQSIFGIIGLRDLGASDKGALSRFNAAIGKLQSQILSRLAIGNLSAYLNDSTTLSGCAGNVRNFQFFINYHTAKETSASVDSELSVLASLPFNTPVTSRLNNPLYYQSKNFPKQPFPILLVSRLDAPTPQHVRNIIDTSVAVEKNNSFTGNVLIDSQGKPWSERTDLAKYDHDITMLAREDFGRGLSVIYDGNPELAGKTERIALYLGWYSLRNYKDNYSFNPGAVGYHIASFEAKHIHSETELGWCKNLLERGVVATVGAVDEPYLDSFPETVPFFSFLLSGKYHLVEAYFLSNRYVGWRQVLFGDPLYKPIPNVNASKKRGIDLGLEVDQIPTPGDLIKKTFFSTANTQKK